MLSDVGYYARIGANFDVSEAGLVRAYKRTALEHHPDRNGSTPEAIQLFQEITTAKAILEKPEARESYDRIVRLRTYMSQCDDTETMMDPYLIYSLYKINKKNVVQNRLLTFDFVKKVIQNWKKDELRTTFKFEEIIGVEALPDNEFELRFRNRYPYRYRAMSSREQNLLFKIFNGIVKNDLSYKMDDRKLPPKSLMKGEVEKRGSMGGFSKRYVMLGFKRMLIFREKHFKGLVNCMPLVIGETKIETPSSHTLLLKSAEQTFLFRFENQVSRNRYEFIARKILLGEIDDIQRSGTEAPFQHNRSKSLQPIQLSSGNPLSLIAHPLENPSFCHDTSGGTNSPLVKSPCGDGQDQLELINRPDLPHELRFLQDHEPDAAIDIVQVQKSDPSRTDRPVVTASITSLVEVRKEIERTSRKLTNLKRLEAELVSRSQENIGQYNSSDASLNSHIPEMFSTKSLKTGDIL